MSVYSDFIVRFSADLGGFDTKVNAARARVASLSSGFQSAGLAISAGITAPIVAFGAASLRAFGEIEALKKGLETLEGTAAKAERRFTELLEVAKLPGIGITEAIRADLALRNYGFTAERAKTITLEFGNALAAAGRGKEDLEEVTRQLGQMASRGKVTADNLRPIIERIPQAAAIIRREFGTVDTEVLQKMGVSSERMTDVLIRGLSAIKRVEGGWKNAMSNISDSWTLALNEIGQGLKPLAERIANDFVVPAIDKIKDLAKTFGSLPSAQQNAILGFTAFAAAIGPVTLALGSLSQAMLNIQLLARALPAVLAVGPWAALALAVAGVGVAAWKVSGDIEQSEAGLMKNRDAYMRWAQSIGMSAEEASRRIAAAAPDMSPWRPVPKTLDEMRAAAARGEVQFDKFSSKITVTGAGIAATGKAATAATPALAGLGDKVSNLEKAFNLLGVSSPADIKKMEAALGLIEAAWRRGEATLEQLIAAAARLGAEYGKLAEEASGPLVRSQAYLALGIDAAKQATLGAIRAVYDFNTAGEAWGKKLGYIRSEIDDTALRTRLLLGEIERLGQVKPISIEVEAGKGRRGILEAEDILAQQGLKSQAQLRREANSAGDAYERIVQLQREHKATALDVARAREVWVKAEKASLNISEDATRAASEMRRHFDRHVHQLAGSLTSLIEKGGKFWDVMAGFGKKTALSAAQAVLETQLKRITGLLVDIIGKSGIASKALGALFGVGASAATGAAGSAAGSAAGQAGSTAAGAARTAGQVNSASQQAAGSAAQAGGGGAMETAGQIGQMVSAATGVIGVFQAAHQTTLLGRIEENTRRAEIHLGHLLRSANAAWPWMEHGHARLKQIVDGGVGVYNALGDQGIRLAPGAVMAMAGGGGDTYSFRFDNCTFGAGMSAREVSAMFRAGVEQMRLGGHLA